MAIDFKNINPQKIVKQSFGKAAIRAYYAEFAGMVFFLGISVGTVVGAFKTVSGYSESFLKVSYCGGEKNRRDVRFSFSFFRIPAHLGAP